MSDENPLARAGRDSAGDKYDRHRAAARSLIAEPMSTSTPMVSLFTDPDAGSVTTLRRFTAAGRDKNRDKNTVSCVTESQTRINPLFWVLLAAIAVIFVVGFFFSLLALTGPDPNVRLFVTGAVGVSAVCTCLFIWLDDDSALPPRVEIPEGKTFTLADDLDAPEADLVAHAVDALGQIGISETWQSDWLRAPREQIDLTGEAEAIMRAAGRLSDLFYSNGDRPEHDGPQRDRWDALNEIRSEGLTALRERVVDALALRLAVDDVADLIAEADELRRTDANLSRSDALAAQILADIPEHARAADRLAELTAATGGTREVLERELTARRAAIDTAAHALAERGELT